MTIKDFDDTNETHYGMSGSPTKVQRVFPPKSDIEKETWKGAFEETAEKLFKKIKELKFI